MTLAEAVERIGYFVGYSSNPADHEALAVIKSALPVWLPIESAPKDGTVLVYLESQMLGSRIHTARFHPKVTTIGGVFEFDAPKPTHWMPLPEPPK